MKEKGFATSAILYTILLLFLVLMVGILNNLQNKKTLLDALKKDTIYALEKDTLVDAILEQVGIINGKITEIENQITKLQMEKENIPTKAVELLKITTEPDKQFAPYSLSDSAENYSKIIVRYNLTYYEGWGVQPIDYVIDVKAMGLLGKIYYFRNTYYYDETWNFSLWGNITDNKFVLAYHTRVGAKFENITVYGIK